MVSEMLVVFKAIMMALEMIKIMMGMLSEIVVVVMVVEMEVVITELIMVKVRGKWLIVLLCSGEYDLIVFYMYCGRVQWFTIIFNRIIF